MTTSITTRAGKGSPLTHAEVDANFTNLQTTADGAETTANAALPKAGGTMTGPVTMTGGTVTASTPLIDATQTWNAAGVTFTGWKLNVTDTASAAGSLLADWQVGGLSALQITKAGALRVYGTYTDSSNYVRASLSASTTAITLAGETAGTGADNIDVNIQSAGSGFTYIGAVGGNSVIKVAPVSTASYFGESGVAWTAFIQRSGRRFSLAKDTKLTWTDTDGGADATQDVGFARSARGVIAITDGSTGAGCLEMSEQTAPSAPSANGVRIYAVDNGAGKTQLMALFSSGAAQQLAIQP